MEKMEEVTGGQSSQNSNEGGNQGQGNLPESITVPGASKPENNCGGKNGKYFWVPALIIGICIVASCIAIAHGFINFKSKENRTISATGSASMNFDSDLIIWRGSFLVHAATSKGAYDLIKKDADKVKKYLLDNGVYENEIALSSVDISQRTKDIYDSAGNYIGVEPDGFDLRQGVSVASGEIDKVVKISRESSSLLESGVQFTSDSPEFYCTTLDDVKLELIDKAAKNSKDRIDIIAKNTGAKLGGLVYSSLGVFQITAKNSGTSDYTYDGAFDTSSWEKTASITVKLEYELK